MRLVVGTWLILDLIDSYMLFAVGWFYSDILV